MAVSADHEWEFSGELANLVLDIDNLHFLMEGYLHITEEKTDHPPYGIYASPLGNKEGVGGAAQKALISRTADSRSSLKSGWKRRWCVLSQTPDDVHLVYYKHQSSFTNCEPPVGVVFMEGCQSLYTIPSHSKSNNTFAISFPNRNIIFYPDKDEELDSWLEAFRTTLNLLDTTNHSPLKGLPKQKAERKDFQGHPAPHEEDPSPQSNHSNPKRAQNEVPSESPDLGLETKIKVLSYRSIPEEEVDMGRSKRLSLTRPTHNRPKLEEVYENPTKELDSEKGPIQFLGFKMLDT